MISNKSSRNWVLCLCGQSIHGALRGSGRSDFFVSPTALGPEWRSMSSIRGVDRSKVARGAHFVDHHLRIVTHDGIASDRPPLAEGGHRAFFNLIGW